MSEPSARLNHAWQALRRRWEEIKLVWNDPVRRAFEQEFWTPLEEGTSAAQREMENLAKVIAQARRRVQ